MSVCVTRVIGFSFPWHIKLLAPGPMIICFCVRIPSSPCKSLVVMETFCLEFFCFPWSFFDFFASPIMTMWDKRATLSTVCLSGQRDLRVIRQDGMWWGVQLVPPTGVYFLTDGFSRFRFAFLFHRSFLETLLWRQLLLSHSSNDMKSTSWMELIRFHVQQSPR